MAQKVSQPDQRPSKRLEQPFYPVHQLSTSKQMERQLTIKILNFCKNQERPSKGNAENSGHYSSADGKLYASSPINTYLLITTFKVRIRFQFSLPQGRRGGFQKIYELTNNTYKLTISQGVIYFRRAVVPQF